MAKDMICRLVELVSVAEMILITTGTTQFVSDKKGCMLDGSSSSYASYQFYYYCQRNCRTLSFALITSKPLQFYFLIIVKLGVYQLPCTPTPQTILVFQ